MTRTVRTVRVTLAAAAATGVLAASLVLARPEPDGDRGVCGPDEHLVGATCFDDEDTRRSRSRGGTF